MSVDVTPSGTRGGTMPRVAVALMGLMPGLYRLLKGRGMSWSLILTTVGAKTGLKRDAHLTAFPEADSWLVVGSKGGSATHPAWYINMARNPDQVWVEVGNRRTRVKPETLKGADRAKAWRRIVSEYGNYGAYEKKTDREIPVVRLTPAA